MDAGDDTCASCGRRLMAGGFFVVRVDVYADPSPEAIDTKQLQAAGAAGHDSAVAALLQQMATMSDEELQDGVARHFEYRVCGACQRLILSNPLGLPRRRAGVSSN